MPNSGLPPFLLFKINKNQLALEAAIMELSNWGEARGSADFAGIVRGALVNSVGDQPLERYNVAPTIQVALLHMEGETLHADPVRWGGRPHWAKDLVSMTGS